MEKLIDKIKERVDKSDVKGNGYFYDFSKNVFTGKMDENSKSVFLLSSTNLSTFVNESPIFSI